MARRARVEVEGGLYHVITRGNDRQDIFDRPRSRSQHDGLSVITGLDSSSVSRRYDSARQKAQRNRKLAFAKELVAGKYYETVEESNA